MQRRTLAVSLPAINARRDLWSVGLMSRGVKLTETKLCFGYSRHFDELWWFRFPIRPHPTVLTVLKQANFRFWGTESSNISTYWLIVYPVLSKEFYRHEQWDASWFEGLKGSFQSCYAWDYSRSFLRPRGLHTRLGSPSSGWKTGEDVGWTFRGGSSLCAARCYTGCPLATSFSPKNHKQNLRRVKPRKGTYKSALVRHWLEYHRPRSSDMSHTGCPACGIVPSVFTEPITETIQRFPKWIK